MQTRQISKIISTIGTPCFVYEEDVLLENINRILVAAEKFDLHNRIKIYVAYFANSNPHLFQIIKDMGAGILLQSQEEYEQIKRFKLTNKVVVSPSFLSDEEINYWNQNNVIINLASLEEIKYFVNKFNAAPSFRIDLTESSKQRTAIKKYQLRELTEFLSQKNIIPRSLHIYIGTGSSLVKTKSNFLKVLNLWRQYFPNTKEINLGGGFAFDYNNLDKNKKHFNWESYFEFISRKIKQLDIPKDVIFVLEPGRDILADAGSLIVSVARVVSQKDKRNIGTDGSYVYMPSATIRRRQHQLTFLGKNFQEIKNFDNVSGVLSGCTTLSSDYLFPGEVKVPAKLKEGDYIIVRDIGAYGATQHMEFLNKKPAPEVLIKSNGEAYLITQRGRDDDKIRYLINKPKQI